MLNSKSSRFHHIFSSLILVIFMVLLTSCLPQSTPPAIDASSSTNKPNNTNTSFSDPTFPFGGIFIQEGGLQSTTHFSLSLDFSDSFLLRGKELSQFLKNVPNTTRFCLSGKYTYNNSEDRFLILSAKPKSYTNLVNKTTEYYLQVEPSNDQANQNDCLTYNLTSSLFASTQPPKTASASFSLTQLCATCNSSVTSEGLRLFFNSGEAVPTLNLSQLALTISGSTNTNSNSCVESTVCQARGYNCCLEGICANDGAVRPGAITQTGFTEAQIDVASNPDRFVLYPQFYFVCPSRPEDDGEEDNDEPVDPNYEASVRLMELNHLYQCLNKVDGEFSYCTVKFTSASQKITAGTSFSPSDGGYLEDINFSTLNPNFSSGDYANNIVKIFYAGQTLYEANQTPLLPSDGVFDNVGNDDLTTAQSVKIYRSLPANANDDNLYLTFKVDGSCEKLGTSLAKCSKTYVHNSTELTSTTYHDNTKTYYLPTYADTSTSANIIVKVSGIVVPEDVTTWTKHESPNRIEFASSYSLYQNQTIEITYYVTSSTEVTSLIKARVAAQASINTMCVCATTEKCNLNPIQNESGAIVNYECIHPTTTSNDPPVNQTVYVSGKNVPHRYFDINGLNYDDYSSALDQEGTAFSYKNNDLLKPTNLDAYTGYTGFNEIYGSFSKTSTSAAKPAKVVSVKKNVIYDLFVNSGTFSTCLTCGSDYYSSLQKIFPQHFTGVGGGYSPDNYESRRTGNTGKYRSDDLLFGRACFIPATMIPWTHGSASLVKDQRKNRLASQHFLFANGYNRDWFGFDYGSLIGSFDGVTWFSIGNERRIKATTNKLYLAVNGYYGDLSLDSNFNVTVSETTPYSPSLPDHDTETAGAECQKSHFCSNDNDCFRQLGYDYTCQNVSTLMTSWPQFDANGNEIVGSTTRSLVSILGGSNGQPKRCVYRGRGAPCHANLSSISTTFNNSTLIGTLACSTNNMCHSIASGNSKFNDRIARFANTPTAQNTANAAPTVTDTVGLGARILGRPFDYYGTKGIPTGASAGLSSNGVQAICIPGKNLSSATTTFDLNSRVPSVRTESSDKILGIGITMSSSQSLKYLNACPATDTLGISIQQYDLPLGDTSTINVVTTAQNLSSNLLNLTPIVAQNVFSSTSGSQITAVGYQRNTCLRAPGASCFSDMDCAPSQFIASKVKVADLTGILNSAEEKYWEEDLVCGNPDFKYTATGVLNTSTFNIKNNFCCREYGKNFTVYTETNSSDFAWCDTTTSGSETVKVAGLNMNINSYSRYSRVHTAYDKMTCNTNEVSSTKSFALSLKAEKTTDAAEAIQRYLQQPTQFKTLDTINQRTCCTKNWVRHWATTNGGGHRWGQNKLQTIDKSIFRGLNWLPTDTSDALNPTAYECTVEGYLTQSCEIRNFTDADTSLYLKFFGSLELVGIPQVAVMSDDEVVNENDDSTGAANAAGVAPTGTVNQASSVHNLTGLDFTDSDSNRLYSAANYDAFQSDIKKVFSENEFSCCLPAGQQVPDYTTAEQCCTGYLANSGSSTTLRCCLPDYTDLTVYMNRYVSSEGRGLPDSAYDSDTGYIKDPGVVEMLANQKSLCCSGKMARGVAIRKLPIPITNGQWINQEDAWTRRFTYLSSAVDNNTTFGPIGSLFDAGIRWNDHVYCIPANVEMPAEK